MAEITDFNPDRYANHKVMLSPKLGIYPKFKDITRPLTEEEKKGLEKQIVKWGLREPLVYWRGFLVDGHHRYEICNRLNIPYKALEYDFPDESHVLEFIHENQIDKRNVTAYERGEHAIAAYKIREEREAKERQGWKNSQNLSTSEYKDSVNHLVANLGQREESQETEGRVERILAKRAGVSHGTMHKITNIVDFAEEADKQALREGKASVHGIYTKIETENQKAKRVFPKEKYRVVFTDLYDRAAVPMGWIPKHKPGDVGRIPVRACLEDQAVVFIRCPATYLTQSLQLLDKWGTQYVGTFILKLSEPARTTHMLLNHEFVLMGSKGGE